LDNLHRVFFAFVDKTDGNISAVKAEKGNIASVPDILAYVIRKALMKQLSALVEEEIQHV
jgi:hypothetical protein